MLEAVVLGSAAGGGFPQWNSNAPACRRARAGDKTAVPRTQASLAVSANGHDWFVLNASPDLRLQIEATPALHPREGLRSSPIAGVVVLGGDVDAVAGLLHLRERHRFSVYAPARVLAVIAANPIFHVLAPDCVERVELPLDRRIELAGAAGPSGIAVIAFAVPAKVPLYLETAGQDPGIAEEGDAVGLQIIDAGTGRSFFFIPGCAAMTDRLRRRLTGSELVFFDGTLWRDDEMIRARRREQDRPANGAYQHERRRRCDCRLPRSGREAPRSLSTSTTRTRCLLDDSPERQVAEAAGWEIAYDGMEVRL